MKHTSFNKQTSNIILFLALSFFGMAARPIMDGGQPAALPAALPAADTTVQLATDSPIMFIENAGQLADGVRFQAQGDNGLVRLASDAIWITLVDKTDPVGIDPVRLS